MRTLGTRVFWGALALAVLTGVAATPSLGALPTQEPLEGSVPIDVMQVKSEVALDIPASVFAFEPVVVKIGKAGKTKTPIGIEIKLKNNSDTDYFVHATATLHDADGKPIASESAHKKADDHNSARLSVKFKVPNADVARVKTCALRFAFERD